MSPTRDANNENQQDDKADEATKTFNIDLALERNRIIALCERARNEGSYLRRMYSFENGILAIPGRTFYGIVGSLMRRWGMFEEGDVEVGPAVVREDGEEMESGMVRVDTRKGLAFEWIVLQKLGMREEMGYSVLLAEMEARAETWASRTVGFWGEDGKRYNVVPANGSREAGGLADLMACSEKSLGFKLKH